MRFGHMLLLLGAVALIATGCLDSGQSSATPKSTAKPKAATSTPSVSPTISAEPTMDIPLVTTTPAPTMAPLPANIQRLVDSRFGFNNAGGYTAGGLTFSLAMDAGGHWDRPSPGPFSWQKIEPVKGRYDFSSADAYVRKAGESGFTILATIWPFADWDQKSCQPLSCMASGFPGLATMRCRPCDMQAYRDFLKAMVERYSSGPYPIRYWEILNEPSARGRLESFRGTPEEYAELLKESYAVIKGACPDCKVLNGGLAGSSDAGFAFHSKVFAAGGAPAFDIGSVHSVNDAADGNVAAFRSFLYRENVSRPVWATELSYGSGDNPPSNIKEYQNYFISDDEHAQMVFKGVVRAFAAGAQKVFYSVPSAAADASAPLQSEALAKSDGARRPAFSAFRALAGKLDYFTRVNRISEGRYRFTVGNATIFVLWGEGPLPADLPSDIVVTDHLGRASAAKASGLKLSSAPFLAEAALVPT
ncbi:MAG: beta-galactosidase [Candidatus Micrarchaeota archaeon]